MKKIVLAIALCASLPGLLVAIGKEADGFRYEAVYNYYSKD